MEKKKIKIGFCGFWSSFNPENNLFTNILKRYFDVEISQNPDYIFCSNRGLPFEYMKYDCIRIMFMGENISPDFTLFDYVIGFDFLDFSDRYFRLPFAFYNDTGNPFEFKTRSLNEAKDILKNKEIFCNFIYGHESSHGMREELFKKISEYKPVVSAGSFLNNTSTKGCSWMEKKRILLHSKFTIASDSVVYPGFVTEKIVDPFVAGSVPIYFGNPKIDVDFNKNAFIWCKDISDIDRTVEEIKRIDNDDEAYIRMLSFNPLNDNNYISNMYRELENFLINIFSQDLKKAERRIKYFAAQRYEKEQKEILNFIIFKNRFKIKDRIYKIKKERK